MDSRFERLPLFQSLCFYKINSLQVGQSVIITISLITFNSLELWYGCQQTQSHLLSLCWRHLLLFRWYGDITVIAFNEYEGFRSIHFVVYRNVVCCSGDFGSFQQNSSSDVHSSDYKFRVLASPVVQIGSMSQASAAKIRSGT